MVVLFALSVVAIALAVSLVVAGIYIWLAEQNAPRAVYAAGALGTVLLIAMVSIVNVVRLAQGGTVVARLAGGRLVPSSTQDALERRLRNIVEEMAIASGVRLPQVFVLDGEKGINAFAAGWDVSGSVVAVTRGALEKLTRDELQAVIGHEFSHILNGDTALNIRMIGVLAGIVALGSVAEFMMRMAGEADDIRAAVPLFIAGGALFLIGYIGLFFARLIKAAVSREREFLADASSVQFTRNPDAIAGALDQIGASGAGTLIHARYAEEMSHMFFGQSIRMKFSGLFDTHPPLEERIRRAHPRFMREDYRKRRTVGLEIQPTTPEPSQPAPPAGRRAVDLGTAWGRSAMQSALLVGSVDPAKVDYAARLIAALPAALRESLGESEGACAALISLLLAPKHEVMQQQLDAMSAVNLGELAQRAAASAAFTRSLSPAFHLPVIDLALPAVKAAPEEAKKKLLAGIEAVINADRRVSLHEFVVLTLVRHQLGPRERRPSGNRKLDSLRQEAGIAIALVAHAGTRADASGARAQALKAAMSAGADAAGIVTLPQHDSLTLEQADGALMALKSLAPFEKARLIKGLFAAVTADGVIRVGEAELMRLVGAVLDCPLPPLLDEMDPAALEA